MTKARHESTQLLQLEVVQGTDPSNNNVIRAHAAISTPKIACFAYATSEFLYLCVKPAAQTAATRQIPWFNEEGMTILHLALNSSGEYVVAITKNSSLVIVPVAPLLAPLVHAGPAVGLPRQPFRWPHGLSLPPFSFPGDDVKCLAPDKTLNGSSCLAVWEPVPGFHAYAIVGGASNLHFVHLESRQVFSVRTFSPKQEIEDMRVIYSAHDDGRAHLVWRQGQTFGHMLLQYRSFNSEGEMQLHTIIDDYGGVPYMKPTKTTCKASHGPSLQYFQSEEAISEDSDAPFQESGTGAGTQPARIVAIDMHQNRASIYGDLNMFQEAFRLQLPTGVKAISFSKLIAAAVVANDHGEYRIQLLLNAWLTKTSTAQDSPNLGSSHQASQDAETIFSEEVLPAGWTDPLMVVPDRSQPPDRAFFIMFPEGLQHVQIIQDFDELCLERLRAGEDASRLLFALSRTSNEIYARAAQQCIASGQYAQGLEYFLKQGANNPMGIIHLFVEHGSAFDLLSQPKHELPQTRMHSHTLTCCFNGGSERGRTGSHAHDAFGRVPADKPMSEAEILEHAQDFARDNWDYNPSTSFALAIQSGLHGYGLRIAHARSMLDEALRHVIKANQVPPEQQAVDFLIEQELTRSITEMLDGHLLRSLHPDDIVRLLTSEPKMFRECTVFVRPVLHELSLASLESLLAYLNPARFHINAILQRAQEEELEGGSAEADEPRFARCLMQLFATALLLLHKHRLAGAASEREYLELCPWHREPHNAVRNAFVERTSHHGSDLTASPLLGSLDDDALSDDEEQRYQRFGDLGLGGELYVWGTGEDGRLGLGEFFVDQHLAQPMHVIRPLRSHDTWKVLSVSCGQDFSTAITSGGIYTWGNNQHGQSVEGLWGWGNNDHGQLALPHYANVASPKRLMAIERLSPEVLVAGAYHTAFITQQGKAFACGRGCEGQLFNTVAVERQHEPQPIFIPEDGTPIRLLAAGAFCTILVSHGHRSWLSGELRAIDVTTKHAPRRSKLAEKAAPLPGPRCLDSGTVDIAAIDAIEAHTQHAIALLEEGSLAALGSNSSAAMGLASNGVFATWQPIPNLKTCFQDIGVGETFSVAIDNDGRVWSWGTGRFGELGTNELQAQRQYPSVIPDIDAQNQFSLQSDLSDASNVALGRTCMPAGLRRKRAISAKQTVKRTTPQRAQHPALAVLARLDAAKAFATDFPDSSISAVADRYYTEVLLPYVELIRTPPPGLQQDLDNVAAFKEPVFFDAILDALEELPVSDVVINQLVEALAAMEPQITTTQLVQHPTLVARTSIDLKMQLSTLLLSQTNAFVQTQQEQDSRAQVVRNILDNVHKAIVARPGLSLSHGAAYALQDAGRGEVTAGRADVVIFSCGHHFPKQGFDAQVLQRFAREVQQSSSGAGALWANVLRKEYQKSAGLIQLACPNCVLSTLSS
ncbi:uncharacterized protein MONBRDRAFT_30797 [Monosiga brevicollis MX1]|uniref:Uncharacterized protein n=1 Tax=Monosiga brevicollis TaxID=81824 RepID=A9UPB1_MONBE|nr:uncharacterized protein MONBRDRAFT_30797 [Monosiga brevicollis MX1]EDQ92845.1 predicted protein [Monosiga brevicollis MX1]|eukprot:XP_001742607.1 hypothetical protein [Monosiga brevicollis MX1]